MSWRHHHILLLHNKTNKKDTSDLPTVVVDRIIKILCSSQCREKFNTLCFSAIHETDTPFSFFVHEICWNFCQEMNPFWRIPSADNISTVLLQNSYNTVMNELIDMIKRCCGCFMVIDGAINLLSKSQSNLFVHVHVPLFIEYLSSNIHFQRETIVKVVIKIEDFIAHLTKLIWIQTIYAFVFDSCNGMRDVLNTSESRARLNGHILFVTLP